MLSYVYRCKKCKKTVELQHSITEVDNLPPDLQKLVECNETCPQFKGKKKSFNLVPQPLNYTGFSTLSKELRTEKLKKRSSEHFKKEILPQKREKFGLNG